MNLTSQLTRRNFIRSNLLLIFLLLFQVVVFGQGKQISGTVSDKTGEPLPGVNVVIKGTTVGTTTDFNGKYSIAVKKESEVLVFSFVGYIEQNVVVGNQTTINVALKEDVMQLNEVVAIGYGVQKKSDVTGSVASISSETLEKQSSIRVDEALQGKAAGVVVLQNSGQPGSSPAIRIRGLATINGGNPLVIIDGNTGGSLSNLNVGDIESIEVLKDAASQGIYGSAGGNGVILVTTKKGKSGKLKVDFNSYVGFQKPWSLTNVPICNAQQYAEIYDLHKTAAGANPYFPYNESTGQYLNPLTNEPLANTNWINEIFQTGAVQNYNISLSGGNKKSNFFFSVGYSAEEGTLKRTSNDRWIIRLNSEHKLGDRIKIGQNFNINTGTSSGQNERNEYNSPVSAAVQMLPFVPVYATDGSGNFAYSEAGLPSNIQNPLSLIEYNNNITRSNSYFGNAFIRADLLKGLSFESRISGNYNPSSYVGYTPKYQIGRIDNPNPSQTQLTNTVNYNLNESYGWQWQNVLTYDNTFADVHHLNVVLGMESGYSMIKNINRQGLGTDAGVKDSLYNLDWKTYNDTTGLRILQDNQSESSGFAYFARVTYDYDGIYLLQANFRRDYSSKFGANNRAGNFPSISAGIKFSEFSFIKDLGFIDFGKLRIGYGETGNSDIQPNLYLNSFGQLPMNGYPFGGVTRPGASLLTAANPDLKWETVVTENIGLDLRFLNNRLSFSAEVFQRKNKDMLLRKSVPLAVGYVITDAGQELGNANLDTRPLVNYGTLNNKGYELSLDYKDHIGEFNFSVNANITHAITIIEDIGDPLYAGNGRGNTNVCVTKNGEAVSTFYGYKIDGVYQESDLFWYKQSVTKKWLSVIADPNGSVIVSKTSDINMNPIEVRTKNSTTKPGYYRYADTNNDGKIDNKDLIAVGNPNPDFTFGIGANLEYKGFDLNLFFQGSYGNDIYNLLKVNSYSGNNGGLNWAPELVNAYLPAVWDSKDLTKEPYITTEAKNTNTGLARIDGDLSPSNFYVEDGSYLRLKNIQLGYTFPSSFNKKLKISSLRIYIGAKNLLTFTKYTGFDPEVGETTILERGFDRGTYPQSKLFTFGVNLSI
jgi:TonB-dependent starch-binding outer membrane protein SusC